MTSKHPEIAAAVAFAMLAVMHAPTAQAALDYEYYKSRVEPVFMKKRPGHARCTTCHIEGNNAFKLQKPSDKTWSDEQSRKNFEMASGLVTPGTPEKSHLLMYPLHPAAGGTTYHSGGRQFASRNDADWKIMAAWVNGAKLKPAPDPKK